jgi:hypothetical protein
MEGWPSSLHELLYFAYDKDYRFLVLIFLIGQHYIESKTQRRQKIPAKHYWNVLRTDPGTFNSQYDPSDLKKISWKYGNE